jgi:hypothetical protein
MTQNATANLKTPSSASPTQRNYCRVLLSWTDNTGILTSCCYKDHSVGLTTTAQLTLPVTAPKETPTYPYATQATTDVLGN